MSVQINTVTTTPQKLDSALGEQNVTIIWSTTMTAATDNPVNFELTIVDESDPVFFVSDTDSNEKAIAWDRDLNLDDGNYKKTIVMIVTKTMAQNQKSKLRMVTTGADGVTSRKHFTLTYK